MANTATKVSASPNHLTYLLTGDGTVAGPTIANATLLADMVYGPLRDAWNAALTTQAAMRNQLLGGLAPGSCDIHIQLVSSPVDTTAQVNQPFADVDTDAVTITKAELNISMSDTTGQLAYLHIRHRHSIIP